MSGQGDDQPLVLAEFGTSERLLAAIRHLRQAGYARLDAFAPFALEGLHEALGGRPSRVRLVMLAGGVLGAGGAYLVEWLSAVMLYPFNTGSRPLHSWGVFLLVPFEVGVLAASLAGFVTFLWRGGLTSLHHPIFAVPGFERASRDRFFLAVEDAGSEAERRQVRNLLESLGAETIREVAR